MNDKKPKTTTGRVRTRREVLRRHRRERQIVIFGILIIALGGVAFMGASIYSGRTPGPFVDPIITNAANDQVDSNLPCPPDTPPLDPSRVRVRVLNGTTIQGLAGNTLDKLTGRGFLSGGATNWSRGKYDGAVLVLFGSEGVAQGYTVARNFTDVEYVQDTRDNTSVDVVLGAKYDEVTTMRPQFAPELDKSIVLSAPGPCVSPSEVSEVPAPHTYPKDPPVLTPTPSATPSTAGSGSSND